jgi:hypothetical protein
MIFGSFPSGLYTSLPGYVLCEIFVDAKIYSGILKMEYA